MGRGRKVLSADHTRALIKQAIGILFGDAKVEADATAEIFSIEARLPPTKTKSTRPRPRAGT